MDPNIKHNYHIDLLRSLFDEISSSKYSPKSLFIDTDTNTINNITQSYKNLYENEFLLTSENIKNGYNGSYGLGIKSFSQNVIHDKIRKLVEKCDNTAGFVYNRSMSGGTGSGLGNNILQHISTQYRKKMNMSFEIMNGVNNPYCLTEAYNNILVLHSILDETELSIPLDNQKLYKLCRNELNIDSPNYNDYNLLITKISSKVITECLGLGWQPNVGLAEYGTNLIPFPRLHFITTSISPILNKINIQKICIPCSQNKLLIDGYLRNVNT
eukprot:401960_1